jgi:DnaJ-class molecular chaperone
LGGHKNVEAPYRNVSLTIPAGTQTDDVLRLRGEGIKARTKIGDLYIRVKIPTPKKLTLKQKELLKKLSDELAD